MSPELKDIIFLCSITVFLSWLATAGILFVSFLLQRFAGLPADKGRARAARRSAAKIAFLSAVAISVATCTYYVLYLTPLECVRTEAGTFCDGGFIWLYQILPMDLSAICVITLLSYGIRLRKTPSSLAEAA